MSPGTGSVGNAKMVVHLRRPPRIGQPDGEGKGNRRPPSRPDGYGVSSGQKGHDLERTATSRNTQRANDEVIELIGTTCLSRFGETKSDEIARYEKQGHSPDEQQERAHHYRSSLSAEPHSRGHRIMDSPMDACERRRCCRNPKSERRAPFSDGPSATASKGRRAAPTRDKARG